MDDFKQFIKTFPKGLWLTILIVVIIILALPAILTRSWFLDFSDKGQIGDTIGGIMGPFIAIVAAFLTFIAFWTQYIANKELINENRRNHFENRFYKLLDIHLDNVKSLSSNYENSLENTCFKNWCDEIASMFNLIIMHGDLGGFIGRVHLQFKDDPEQKGFLSFLANIQGSKEDYFKIIFETTYSCFYYGDFSILEYGDERQTQYVRQFSIMSIQEIIRRSSLKIAPPKNELLGRYYRHLFQIVTFVDSRPDDLFEGKDWKRDFIGVLRSQMSDYEQLLLYYNAQSSVGKSWDENHFIEKYRLIKNIPYQYIGNCAGLSPSIRYRDAIKNADAQGERFFERW